MMMRVRLGAFLACVAFVLSVVTSTPSLAAAPAKPVISYVFYDGAESRTEGDEYAVVKNAGGTEINLKGWLLNAGDRGQNFSFPSYVLKPGASVRIYTNRTIKGAFSFGIRKAIWNNGGDCGYLFTASGKQASEYCY